MNYPTPPPSPKPLIRPEDRIGQTIDRYLLISVLGSGAYGTVYKARHVDTGMFYAVKALNKTGLDPRQRAFQEREIKLHHYASGHPNVVSMEAILDAEDCTFVVLEYCSEGDLFSKITDECDYIGRDLKAKTVFLQILDAVQHCHTNGVYHRDLKPENVLVTDDGWTVKLADFGLATEDRLTSDFGCGSTFYMSPECQQANPKPFACYSSEANDVWSLGVILVNLTCGRNPWKRATIEDSTFKAYIRDRNFLQTILPISTHLNRILQRIFELNPKQRVTLDELRYLVQDCPRLSQESFDVSLPPTPEYSPVSTPHDLPATVFPGCQEAVPIMDPLPGQQYPLHQRAQYHHSGPTYGCAPLPTPPQSRPSSPRHNPYTFHARPAPVTASHAAGSASFIPSFPWTRCSNLVPHFTNQVCWRNPLVS